MVKYSAQPGKILFHPKRLNLIFLSLKEEIKAINPQVVVTLGMAALNGIGLRQPLDNVHGRIFNFGSYELIPTFHPNHAVNDPQVKLRMTNDLAKLKELLKKPADGTV